MWSFLNPLQKKKKKQHLRKGSIDILFQQVVNLLQSWAGREINFFSDSHLAPKFFKVVANSRKVGRHFQRQTKPLFYAVIVLEIK